MEGNKSMLVVNCGGPISLRVYSSPNHMQNGMRRHRSWGEVTVNGDRNGCAQAFTARTGRVPSE